MQQRCSVCGLQKPFSDFHRNSRRKTGVCATCKDCAKKRARKWFEDNKERGVAKRAEWHQANRENHLSKMRGRYLLNRESELAKGAEWRTANKDRKAETDKRWGKGNRDKRRLADQRWRENHPERALLLHRIRQARRRSRKLAAEGHYTEEDVSRILKSQNGKCAICKIRLLDAYHVDHIQPLAKGGSNWPRNLQILCEPCNCSKNASDPIDHMQSLGLLL